MPMIFRLPPSQGVFARLLSALLLLAVFAVSLFLGLALFFVILGVAAVVIIALYLRIWWLRRGQPRKPEAGSRGGVTLEGEYTVAKPDKRRVDGSR